MRQPAAVTHSNQGVDMKNKFHLIIAIFFIFWLTGCAQYWSISESEGADSLIYGKIDLTASRFKGFTWFEIRYEAPDGTLKSVMWNKHIDVMNSIFTIENAGPGTYQIMEFGSGGGQNLISFNMGPAVPNVTSIHVKTPGIYYMGTFKYIDKEESFSLERSQLQNEAQLLELLLPRAKGTKWEPKMQVRLNKLRKRV